MSNDIVFSDNSPENSSMLSSEEKEMGMPKRSFFDLYEQGLTAKKMKCTDLWRAMGGENAPVTPRTLQRYYRRLQRPEFPVAKKIFAVLNPSLSDQKIAESLKGASREKNYKFSDGQYLKKDIRIRYDRLSDKTNDPNEIMQMIASRMIDTQGLDHPNLNHYLTDLIREDLDHHILPSTKTKKKMKF